MNKGSLILSFLAFCGLQATAQMSVNPAGSSSGSTTSQGANLKSGMRQICTPNLFKGTGDINIPLYSYSVDGLDLGLSLQYSTDGIKVDDIASNVGLGWNLSFGGTITREVYGTEDELYEREIDTTTSSQYAILNKIGDWAYNENASENTPDIFSVSMGGKSFKFSISNQSNIVDRSVYKTHIYPRQNIQVDIMLNDLSLHAYNQYGGPLSTPTVTDPAALFGYDIYREWHAVPNTTDNDNHTYILRFRITDEHGNQFYFDRGDYQERWYNFKTFHSTVNYNEAWYYVPTSWVLSRVVTYTGKEIVYSYEDDAINYQGYRDQRVVEKKSVGGDGDIRVINDAITIYENKKRLKQITYPNGEVVEVLTDGNIRKDVLGSGKAITGIRIKQGYEAAVTNSFAYNFNYAYFNTDAGLLEAPYPTNSVFSPERSTRLKLKSIDKMGFDGVTKELYYTFGYVGDDGSQSHLPQRLSTYQDCYGYYTDAHPTAVIWQSNPAAADYSGILSQLQDVKIPWHVFEFDNNGNHVTLDYGSGMSSNWTYAQANLLNEIKSGAGGRIKLSYGSHNLSNVPDFETSTNTGYYYIPDVHHFHPYYSPPPDLDCANVNDGVSLQSITYEDGVNTDNNTTDQIIYSGGLRFFHGGYFWRPTVVDQDFATYPYTGSAIQREYQNSFISPIDYVNGSNHGYSYVTVKTTAASGELLAKTDYSFTNLISQDNELVNGVDDPGKSRLNIRYGLFSHDYHRRWFQKQYLGLLKSKKVYSPVGDLLQEDWNVYDEHKYGDSVSQYLEQTSFSVLGSSGSDQQGFTFPSSIVQLLSSHSATHSGSDVFYQHKTYTYDSDDDLLSTNYVDSKGDSIRDVNYYTRVQSGTSYLGTASLYAPTSHQWLKWLIGTYKDKNLLYRTTSVTSDLSYTMSDVARDGLGQIVSGWTSSAVYPIVMNSPTPNIYFDAAYTFHSTTPTAIPTERLTKHFTLFDDQKNPLETGYDVDQSYSASIFDTRIGEKIAHVVNAKYNDIAYCSFEGNFLPADDYNKGNWNFSNSHVHLAGAGETAMTGRYFYNMDYYSDIVSKNSLSPQKYFISLWYKGDCPSVIYDGGTAPMTTVLTVGDWHLATYELNAYLSTSHVTIHSASSSIDELRMHPIDALMETYTYEPLKGISSHCDPRNSITYFEYDIMGRPSVTRDINRNILSLSQQKQLSADH